MRAIWSGLISFGLVSIPIELYPATKKRDVRFHLLHDTCHTRVEYLRYCPKDDITLQPEEIVKGYEYERGHYVTLTEEDLRYVDPKLGKTIEILDFVKVEEVDPIYFQKSYLLMAKPESLKAYSLLTKALQDKKMAAIGKMVVKNKEYLALIREREGVLNLETLYLDDEIIDKKDLPATAPSSEMSEKEIELAEDLVERMSAKFDPSKYRDEHKEKLERMIDKKIEGEEIVVPEVEEARVIDLMAALKESVEQVEKKKEKRGEKRAVSVKR